MRLQPSKIVFFRIFYNNQKRTNAKLFLPIFYHINNWLHITKTVTPTNNMKMSRRYTWTRAISRLHRIFLVRGRMKWIFLGIDCIMIWLYEYIMIWYTIFFCVIRFHYSLRQKQIHSNFIHTNIFGLIFI